MEAQVLDKARQLIGQLLRSQRQELGINVRTACQFSGMSIEQINNIESGLNTYTIDQILLYAHGINCQIFFTLQPKITDRDKHDFAGLENPPE